MRPPTTQRDVSMLPGLCIWCEEPECYDVGLGHAVCLACERVLLLSGEEVSVVSIRKWRRVSVRLGMGMGGEA